MNEVVTDDRVVLLDTILQTNREVVAENESVTRATQSQRRRAKRIAAKRISIEGKPDNKRSRRHRKKTAENPGFFDLLGKYIKLFKQLRTDESFSK